MCVDVARMGMLVLLDLDALLPDWGCVPCTRDGSAAEGRFEDTRFRVPLHRCRGVQSFVQLQTCTVVNVYSETSVYTCL